MNGVGDDASHLKGSLVTGEILQLNKEEVADLERIGDIAENISERALELNQEPPIKPRQELPEMAEGARAMLRDSLDAFVREDPDLALTVCQRDDRIDDLTAHIFNDLLSQMQEQPEDASRATRTLFVAKYLERVADHATNIAEMVIISDDIDAIIKAL